MKNLILLADIPKDKSIARYKAVKKNVYAIRHDNSRRLFCRGDFPNDAKKITKLLNTLIGAK